MGSKRKHEDAADAQTPPTKKSKSAARSQRRRERINDEIAQGVKKEHSVKLGEHEVHARSNRDIKRRERKQLRKEAAAGTLATYDDGVVPEDAVDHAMMDEHQEEVEPKNKDKASKKKSKRKSDHAESKPKQEQSSVTKKPKKPKSTPESKWTLSRPSAGRFIDHDPGFVQSPSGQGFLITAVARELQVLSLETSLLVRTLPAKEGATVTSFAVESATSNIVHVGHSDGGILVWDWMNGGPARSFELAKGRAKALSAVRLNDGDKDACVPYITHADGRDRICLRDGEIHRTKKSLNTFQVLGKAEYVVACSARLALISSRNADGQYSTVELPLPKHSTCMNARMLETPSSGSKKASKVRPQLQLAVGNEDGQIQLYDDVSALFTQGSEQRLPAPRVLHWHSKAVSSVKFSVDGKYLISGGKETVLVLWQLETGRTQFLPHLTSEIERIVVNPQGDRYALQMGDNSIMVLSTAELKPVANFAGLQMPTTQSEGLPPPACALHPKQPKQLLLTVPASQPKSVQEVTPRPFLQTFDLRTARHVTRQALTRNNATDFNVGPEDNPILPPDVALLALSQDGEWLATVDEWMPPASDVAHLATKKGGVAEERQSRREVYLKFWHWDASQEIWTLSTRADAPHSRAGGQSMGAGLVLAIASDPASNGFATVGEDSCVKLWKPKTRMRSGVAVKDAKDVELVEWTCKKVMQLAANSGRADSPMDTAATPGTDTAALAYSSDGSLLALSHTVSSTADEVAPMITFIDTATGIVKSLNPNLSNGTRAQDVAFLGRHFVTLTHKAAFIWDLVSDTLVQKVKLIHHPRAEPLLAVNEADSMYAIATPTETEGKQARVMVHSTRHTGILYEQDFETAIVKVLSGKGTRGFVLVFADATVRTILPTGVAGNALISAEASAPVGAGAQMEIDTAPTRSMLPSSLVNTGDEGAPAFEVDEDDRPVVRPEQLAGIFDFGQSFALPPVKDMFQAVVGLFGRPPEQQVA